MTRNSSINKRIQIILDELGYNQRDFAKLTGITEAAICRYIKGNRVPNSDNILRICDATGVSPNWLLGYGNDNEIEMINK